MPVSQQSSRLLGLERRILAALLPLLASLVAGTTSAQSIRAVEYDEEDGLPSVQVYDIEQLDDGRMVFATRDGLLAFDGVRWESDESPGPRLPSTSHVEQDSQGRLWVASYLPSGLIAVREGDGWRFLEPPQGNSFGDRSFPNQLKHFHIVREGEREVLLAGTGAVLFQLDCNDIEAGWREVYRRASDAPEFHDFAWFGQAAVIASDAGLESPAFDHLGHSLNELLAGAGVGGEPVIGLVREEPTADRPEQLWVLGHTWIGHIVQNEFVLDIAGTPSFDHGLDQVLQPDGAQGLLVGTSTVLLHFVAEEGAIEEIRSPDEPRKATGARAMFRDREAVFWVATERGILRMPSLRFLNRSRADGLLDREVTAILEQPEGRMVFAHREGLSFLEDGRVTQLDLPLDGDHLQKIVSLTGDREGNLWVTRDREGVMKVAPDLTVEYFPIHEDDTATSVFTDGEGGVWLTFTDRLERWDGTAFVPVEEARVEGRVRRGVALSDGRFVLLTGANGLFVGRPGAWEHVAGPDEPLANGVYDALLDFQGRLLVASSDGLLQVLDGRLEAVAPDEPELRGAVYGLAEDDRGVLWLGTQDGIVRWDGARAVRRSYAQGLAGHETNRDALGFDSRGRLWVGTVGGASLYRGSLDVLETPPPKLSLLGIRVDREFHPALPAEGRLDLAAGQDDLEIQFRAVSFVDDAEVDYECRLIGYDAGWLRDDPFLASGWARYTNLPAGEYRFEVRATNSRGLRSEVARSRTLRIRAPYWERGWFRAAALLGLGLLVWGGTSLVVERRRSADLEGLVHERTADLQRTERNYREAFEQSRAPELLIDGATNRITAANRAALDLYGHEGDQLVGRAFQDILPPGAERTELLAGELGGGSSLEQVHLTASGEERHVEVYASAYEVDGRRVVQAIVHDVTEKKLLQEQLAAANRMESVGMLAGGIAHDFNNLLTAILGNAELLVQALQRSGITDAALHAGLQAILDSGERAATLTRQLLTFSRRQPVQLEVVDLNEVVRGIEAIVRRLIREDVEIEIALDHDLAHTVAEPSQLGQVVINLVANASDAMPDGGRISIETSNVELDEAFARVHHDVTPGPYVQLLVRDTGIGMDERTLRRIFEPFFTTKPPGQGTGLGLATLHGIIKQADGHVGVESEPGRGTTFRVYLPAVERGTPKVPDVVEIVRDLGGDETILVCEDDEALRTLTTRVFADHGYRVLSAGLPSRAKQLAADPDLEIDLLVTDVVMPEQNGKELARELTLRRPGLQVLFVSGYTANIIEHHGVLEPGVELVHKPFTPLGLLRRVRALLDGEDAAVERGPEA